MNPDLEVLMPTDKRDVVEVLKSELNFVEKGGYGASPREPWRAQLVFEESPSCLNFDNLDKREPCKDCLLFQFVPAERRAEKSPCRHIPLNADGQTIADFYRWGTQREIDEALAGWLRAKIKELEQEQPAGPCCACKL